MKYGLLLILIFILLFLLFIPVLRAEVKLQVDYPELPGAPPITGPASFIKYLYIFALVLSGIAAMLAIIIGGIQYIASAGNPEKMANAKDQIFAAVLGVILLLGAYLVLNTINPDLLTLKEPSLEPISLCKGEDESCKGGEECCSGICKDGKCTAESKCRFIEALWYPKTEAKVGEKVAAQVSGSLECLGKSVKIDVWNKYLASHIDSFYISFPTEKDTGSPRAKGTWTVQSCSPGDTLYFIANYLGSTMQSQNELKVQ